MILILVMVGFVVGAGATVVALAGGGGMVAALAAYGLFSFGAVVFTALIVALAPVWPRNRTKAQTGAPQSRALFSPP
ncbi:hypothetical protein [Maritimibacter sp. HL-12]|uniref:hypothetical protein n=1 Tax=Maritimibacter sp. HL-12 TaxID=1162418 RepID=UPI000A0F29EA|nr:hypothetical protein [Maritimibacter sp. HL-12]SMH54445.1 hypothetical protein SAMN05661107_2942 [Maritimibacter sp. HL-12]